jgi:hypothetical protein
LDNQGGYKEEEDGNERKEYVEGGRKVKEQRHFFNPGSEMVYMDSR